MSADCPIVSVLFCCDLSPYKLLPGVDVWDRKRDARRFVGAGPVIAHPPCRTWGRLRTVATRAPEDEHDLGPWAVEQVRRCGGVLEHPAGSTLFRECGCGADGDAGWIAEVDQWHWGHACGKPTKLYIVGCEPGEMPPMPRREGVPDRCISQGKGIRLGHPKFRSRVTQWEREATPPAFAAWLVDLASRCRTRSWV
ncbi:MAG TPA: hypothetical protein PLA50_04805 [Bacteroidia bacterium]|nr:hypothetical protein [Bacteroidia bacterium]